MDKNTVIGFTLIAIILIGFGYLNRPSQEEIEQRQRYNDSIAAVQAAEEAKIIAAEEAHNQALLLQQTVQDTTNRQQQIQNVFGTFAPAATGNDTTWTVETELLKLQFASKGGHIREVELKNYKTHDSLPLVLFNEESNHFGFTIITNNNRVLNTEDLYFTPVNTPTTDAKGNTVFTLRLLTDTTAHTDFIYTIPADNYMISMDIQPYNMNLVMPAGTNYLEMYWNTRIKQQERGRKFEERYSMLQYKFLGDDIENLSEAKNDQKMLGGKVQWIAFKDQFFSSVLITNQGFTSTLVESNVEETNSPYLKACKAEMTVPFDPHGKERTSFKWYLGPNHYKTLAAYDKGVDKDQSLQLNKLVPLGWKLWGWINRIAVIPMFDFFSRYISNFGIIILLMTIVIKLILFPLTYKSYMSSAKMRVLKPEIDEINARIPAEKAMERQQATMQLYQKVGVSPMSGCLPMLLQMPILLAMFSFFPASIELRQQSFLWADDLSSYDAIISWDAYIPLVSTLFGNHISLFCLLMTITNIIYTKINMASTAGSDQMPGMKWMMYLMPLMFLFIFNNYAAGLSYYYFVSLLITIIQTYSFRLIINDEKVRAKLHEKRKNSDKKPKKSGFAARLEKMQREQMAYQREQLKKQQRR
ncbi:MAG: membrane protein insertase YidC [Paludibacteraceae bacterium]|nr:membrane protein insertase YidC [Paludibacteraceae bacterium]